MAAAEQQYGDKRPKAGKNSIPSNILQLALIQDMLKTPSNDISSIVRFGASHGKESFNEYKKHSENKENTTQAALAVARDMVAQNLDARHLSSKDQQAIAAGIVAGLQHSGIAASAGIPLDKFIRGLTLDLSAGVSTAGTVLPAI